VFAQNYGGSIIMAASRHLSTRLSIAVALFMASALAASASEFTTAVNYAVGNSPISLAVGDFNGDGAPDLAVADLTSGKVSILLGKGNGTFQTAVKYSAGSRPISVAVGDFNGDGFLDLAVVNNLSSGMVSILLGKGDGTFTAEAAYAAGTSSRSVAVGEFNGDGDLDLAVANQGSDNVSILLGNGNGSFQAPVNYNAGTQPVFVTASDLGNNGVVDLAVADASSGAGSTISVLLGNGNGTFQTAVAYDTGSRPESIAVADFNGDGLPDMAAADFNAAEVSVLLGSGNGVFGKAVNYAVGSGPVSIATADFNGDGKADLVTTNFNVKSVSVLIGNGNGTFKTAVNYGTGSYPRAVTAVDLNGDNAPDIEVANDIGDDVSILLNTGGTFVNTTSSPNPSNVGQPVTFSTTVAAGLQGSPVPTGSVTWTDNGTNMLGTVTLSNGQASLVVSTLTAGVHTITTAYSGSSSYNPNSAPPLTQTVNGSGGPAVTFNPASLTFATQLIGTASAPQVVTMSNVGNATLLITNIGVTANFTQTNNCGSMLGAGLSCMISVTFMPAKVGTLSGTLSVTDNAIGSPQTVSLSGTSTVVKLVPSSLSFGNQNVGTTSTPQTVTLTNQSSSSALKITKISITGTDATDFAQNNTCGSSVPPLGNCTITVTFTPESAGPLSASLAVADNGGGSPQTVPLSGTGTN
jgi:hypothetical protein